MVEARGVEEASLPQLRRCSKRPQSIGGELCCLVVTPFRQRQLVRADKAHERVVALWIARDDR